MLVFFFFKQKTAYEMRISDWSSDVCSSDLQHGLAGEIEELVGHGRSLSLKTGAVRRRAEADRGARSPCRAPARRRARRREAVPPAPAAPSVAGRRASPRRRAPPAA